MNDCAKKCIQHNIKCPVKDCRLWIEYGDDLNCSLVAIKKNGRMTLDQVAKRLKLSIVRIKQIQDRTLQKLQKNSHLKPS